MAMAATHSNRDYVSKASQTGVLDEQASYLVVSNMEVGRRLAWKLLSSWNVRLPEDDVVSIVGIALCEAARNYDGREGTQFHTFFYYHLRGRLLREITEIVENKKLTAEYCHEEYSDAVVSQKESSIWYETSKYNAENPERIIVNKEQQQSFDKAFADLDWLEREVITRHYFNSESLMKLADELKYCRCHLSRVKNRAIAQLQKALSTGEVSEKEVISGKQIATSYKGGRGRRKDGMRVVKKKMIPSRKVTAMVLEAAQA